MISRNYPAKSRRWGVSMPGPEGADEPPVDVDRVVFMTVASECGADDSAMVDVVNIVFSPEFRVFCKENRCGNYGRNWRCPPEVGEIDDLIENLKLRTKALVFNHIGPLKSSYDWKGMTENGLVFGRVVRKIAQRIIPVVPGAVVLGAGPCKNCDKCAILTQKPCRYPEKAATSLEACGIDVSQLAKLAGLKYINGPQTITYFGAVFV
jgi:predicted metal-binding protein